MDQWTEPYWRAAKEECLVAPECRACGVLRFPPTPFCPSCQSQDVEWIALSGLGSVFSYTIIRGLPGMPELTLVPVVVEPVDLPGVHLVSNLVDVDPDEVHVGMAVEVEFLPIEDAWNLPVFRALRHAGKQ